MKLKVFLSLLACTIVTAVILVWHFYAPSHDIVLNDGNITIAKADASSKILTVFNLNSKPLISVALDTEENVLGNLKDFQPCTSAHSNSHCWKSKKINSTISLSAQQFGNQEDADVMHCVKISWKTNGQHLPKDCIHLSSDVTDVPTVWFGAHDYIVWHENSQVQLSKKLDNNSCFPYIPGGYSSINPFGKVQINQGANIIEPLWYFSGGASIKASTHQAVKVCEELNSETPKICFQPMFDSTHQDQYLDNDGFHLDYVVCVADSLPSVYRKMVKQFVKPTLDSIENVSPPFSVMLNDGVFYEDQTEINKRNLSFANISHQASLVDQCSLLIKKPLWNFVYRKNEVDIGKINQQLGHLRTIGGTVHFRNITQVYSRLGDYTLRYSEVFKTRNFLTAAREFGLETMLPVTLFVNYDAANFEIGARSMFFVSNRETNAPLLTSFKYGEQLYPAIVDITSPLANDWLLSEVNKLKTEHNVTYFQFYYGQSAWLPSPIYTLSNPLHNIGHFSTIFAETALQQSRCSVSDVAYDSQTLNQLVLLSSSKSMKETLSSTLAASMAGYPFVISNFPASLYEAAMLLSPGTLQNGIIRWIEMVSFFPVVHIPWDYEVLRNISMNIPLLVNLTQNLNDIRNSDEVLPKLKKAFLEAERNTSRPLIAPMWMAPQALAAGTPDIERLLLLEDQFMIGEDMFVAPILDVAHTMRTVFIPPGSWKDVVLHRDVKTETGKWLQNYAVDLFHIPVFVRTNEKI